jgi:L-rhamnose mutarotase
MQTTYALALDLDDNEAHIAAYEKAHEQIWPAVREHLLAHGVLEMKIFRLGTRLCMWMVVDPLRYREEAMALAAQTNPIIRAWENWMWTFQRPTPWTPAGLKWVPMTCIFDLAKQGKPPSSVT